MKYFIGGLFLGIIFFVYPSSAFADLSAGKTWDNSTSLEVIKTQTQIDGNLTVEAGTVLNFTEPITVTVNGSVNFKSGDQPIKIDNINFIINMSPTDISTITNLDLTGSVTITNGTVEITRSRLQSPVGPAITISNSTSTSTSTSTISNNEITNSDIGIHLDSGSAGQVNSNHLDNNGVGIQSNTDLPIQINDNNFFNNNRPRLKPEDPNLALQNLSSVQLDATNNWWGCALDPSDSKNTSCEKLSGNVDFSNWTNSPILNLQSGDIIINEIFPHPDAGSTCEWIEILNTTIFNIPFSDLAIQIWNNANETGKELFSLIMPSKNFAVIHNNGCNTDFINSTTANVSAGSKIAVGLSDDGRELKLVYNNLTLDDQTYPDTNKNIGQTYARFANQFEWTNNISPGFLNKKSDSSAPPPPPATSTETTLTSETLATASATACPASLKISELSSYINCRVTITGKVKNPSGATFYLDDGTGRVKIYLQAAKHIKKPRLFAGYELKVTGLIDNYKTGLRLLPDTAADLEVLNSKSVIQTSSAAKASSQIATNPPNQAAPPAVATSPTLQVPPATILPAAQAAIKGLKTSVLPPPPSRLPLKIALFSAIMLLVAFTSYNLGKSHGNSQS